MTGLPRGPNVFNTKRTTGILKIFWNPLSDGEIENYRVCYDKIKSSVQKCSLNKTVNHEINKVILNDLDAVTDYYIGIQASYDGFVYGELGEITKEKSCEC